MFGILADNVNSALPLHGLAAGTNFLNGASNFHDFSVMLIYEFMRMIQIIRILSAASGVFA
jgi:hypothetical protein